MNKKIIIDCRLWHQGGVGRYIRNLATNLLQIDKNTQYVLFFLKNTDLQSGKLFKSANFEIRRTTSGWHSLSEQTLFLKELLQEKADLVHFPYFSHPCFYNRPFVITIHDLTILKFATGKATTKSYPVYLWKRLVYNRVLKHGVYKARQIIVPTEFVKKDILKNFPVAAEKIAVTYEGVGQELLSAKEETIKGMSSNNFILYVGNFYPHKNVEFLLQVFTHVKGLSLVLAGPDDLFAQRVRQVVDRLNLAQRVKFVLRASDGQLKWLYKRAKALVLPSLFEGFGLPVVEAAYFGCPLLLSDIPVFREIAPRSALFFNPRERSSLLEKINKVVSSKKTTAAGDYFANFSFARMAKQTLTVYQHSLL